LIRQFRTATAVALAVGQTLECALADAGRVKCDYAKQALATPRGVLGTFNAGIDADTFFVTTACGSSKRQGQ
jgi:hypothetical protein